MICCRSILESFGAAGFLNQGSVLSLFLFLVADRDTAFKNHPRPVLLGTEEIVSSTLISFVLFILCYRKKFSV